jgi:hypothetical protein
MEIMRLKPPTLKQRENSVIVFIRHESIASHESIVMNYVVEHGSITNRDVSRICHIPTIKGWRVVRGLLDRNELERVPGTSRAGTAYRKATSGMRSLTARQADRKLSRERESEVRKYLELNPRVSCPILREVFDLPGITAYRLLKKLEAKGTIKRLSGPRNRTAIYERVPES